MKKDNLVDEVFPKENSGKNRPLKQWARISLILALLSIFFTMWLFGVVGVVIGLLGTGSLVGVLLTALVMKKKGRDPSALLAAASAKPIMIFLGLIAFVWFVTYLNQPEYIASEKEYQKNNPGKVLPKDEFFGFVVGQTTFDEAVEIFKKADAKYQVDHFEETNIQSLKSNYYKGTEIPLRHIALEFDDEGKIYSILVWMDRNKLKQEDFYDVNRAFDYKYKRCSSRTFNPKDSEFYKTPSGVEIWVRPDESAPIIEVTNRRKEHQTKCFRREAKLTAAKKAAETFLPEKSKTR